MSSSANVLMCVCKLPAIYVGVNVCVYVEIKVLVGALGIGSVMSLDYARISDPSATCHRL